MRWTLLVVLPPSLYFPSAFLLLSLLFPSIFLFLSFCSMVFVVLLAAMLRRLAMVRDEEMVAAATVLLFPCAETPTSYFLFLISLCFSPFDFSLFSRPLLSFFRP